jgi:hypothetical protein
MLLFTAAALAGNLGWPCSRLNWAWRNVWSTCSINSYIPTNAAPADAPNSFYRALPLAPNVAPTTSLTTAGVVTPGSFPNTPNFFCMNEANTGFGNALPSGNYLRNRCRRAIDAYGGLVKSCAAPAGAFPGGIALRGPIPSGTPDWQPYAGHQPHVSNVQALAGMALTCYTAANPNIGTTPSTTCPGLAGWFSVVWNACNFGTYAPNLSPTSDANFPNVVPYGGSGFQPALFGGVAAPGPSDANAPLFYLCSPKAAAGPTAWNMRGPSFRTSKCRKAMDQFGRTANRCGGVAAPNVAQPAAIAGAADPLRLLALGGTAGPAPMGLLALAPLCN